MKFSVAVFLLAWYICNAIAHPIEQIEGSDGRTSAVKEFKVHILERGTRFVEKIYIDEQNDIEYFKVPPHNRNIETDHLYDFKMNITISRVKKDRVCHLSPLPEDLPRPGMLSKGMRESFSNTGRNDTVKKVFMRWTRGPKVDKSTLRREARDFCGQFPVYHLVPFNPDSVSAVNHGRVKRALPEYPLCNQTLSPGKCNPNDWLWSCRIRDTNCVYYLTCNGNGQMKRLDCKSLSATDHRYDSFVCCNIKCPKPAA